MDEKVIGNITYKELLDILKLPEEVLKKELIKTNYFNVGGEKILNILSSEPYNLDSKNNSIIANLDISIRDKENIENNFEWIKYNFEYDEFAFEDIKDYKGITNRFDLNEKLKNDILMEIPPNFTKLQQSYYIYRRLCQKFSYDEEFYYLMQRKNNVDITINHTDINRLNTLSGKEEIVCTEISLIFAKFLSLLNIPYQIIDYDDTKVDNFNGKHMRVKFKIDDYLIVGDPADGLTESDLSREKTFGSVKKFSLLNYVQRTKDKFKNEIQLVDKYIDKNKLNQEYRDSKEIYMSVYGHDIDMSLLDRINLYIDMIKRQNLKFMDIVNWANNVRSQLFFDYIDNFKVEFIINKNPTNKDKKYELSLLMVYNENEPVNIDYNVNKYLIINQEKSEEQIDYNELKRRYELDIYDFISADRIKFGLEGVSRKNGL